MTLQHTSVDQKSILDTKAELILLCKTQLNLESHFPDNQTAVYKKDENELEYSALADKYRISATQEKSVFYTLPMICLI